MLWFAGGFILQLVIILVTIVSISFVHCKHEKGEKVALVTLAFLQGLVGLGWILTGSVFRWRADGQICSGKDAMPSSYQTANFS